MKKYKIPITAVILVTLVILFALYINGASSNTNNSKAERTVSEMDGLTFAVLGDVHGNTTKLQKAIKDLHSIDHNMDAMILNGDNVDQGLKSQYDAVKTTLNKNSKLLPKIIIKNIGNHDYFNYAKGKNSPEDVKDFINMYLDFSGEKSVYHDTWIKGYHFISLGSESGNTKELGAMNAFLSQKQLDWLKKKLPEKHEKGKPIFVFLHQPLRSSIRGWSGVVQGKELNEILSSYPEVILFTSHTHVLLSVDNVKLNQPYTMAHTGAVAYGILPQNNGIRRTYDSSEGLYVEVQGNKTLIKGRDFVKRSWIFSKEIPDISS